MRQIWAGPPEQLTPITSAPLSRRGTGDPRRSISQEGTVVAGEGQEATTGRGSFCAATWRAARDSLADFGQVAEGFDDQQVSPSLDQGNDLLGECLAGLLGLHAAERRQAHAQRPDITSYQDILACFEHHLAGQFHAGPVDLGYLSVQPMSGQLVAVGAEGVGLDDLRAGFDIEAVDLGDQVRLDRFSSSRHASNPTPRALSMVPIAPSLSSGEVDACSRLRKREFDINDLFYSILITFGIHLLYIPTG